MSLLEAIALATAGREVPPEVLGAAFGEIVRGEATDAQTSGLLVALHMKGESVAEIVTVARVMRSCAQTWTAPDPRTIDTCGTGGSGLDTFSISTTTAFVVAGAGVPVAKHGNRAASGRTGSIDTLEALGVRIDLPIETCVEILGRIGIAPFFARTAHPSFRHLAPLRQQLGIRTLLNRLGPLLNPVGARYQLMGVYDGQVVESIARALGELGSQRALVVHGSDGLDELTTTGPSRAALLDGGEVRSFDVDPADYDLPRAEPAAICGGDVQTNARILLSVLEGEAGARRDVVLLNAAAALWVAGAAEDIGQGLLQAAESIDSGSARAKLRELVRLTGEAA